MGSISPDLLERAASGDDAVALDAGRQLFTRVVEPMADSFDPVLCEAYADSFSEAIARCLPELDAAGLASRYRRVRLPRRFRGPDPVRVTVLSRVTLGADVAVTSVVLDAVKCRFPKAEIVFAGPRKSFELFAGDERLRHVEIAYGRGDTLRQRLAVWNTLCSALGDGLVIDPDSRLTQLGLLPVCDEARYWFFESRSYGFETDDRLPVLTARWLAETFGVDAARPYIAVVSCASELPRQRGAAVGRTLSSAAGSLAGEPLQPPEEAGQGVGCGPGGPPHKTMWPWAENPPHITVSFGVGGNLAKRVADPFEEEVLRSLAGRGSVLVDKGAGGEEAERVQRAIARSRAPVETFSGTFASFAASIAGSRLYVGYDSAGGHVASACGVPLISVFAGAPCERFFHRWRPEGQVIRAVGPEDTIRKFREALDRV